MAKLWKVLRLKYFSKIRKRGKFTTALALPSVEL